MVFWQLFSHISVIWESKYWPVSSTVQGHIVHIPQAAQLCYPYLAQQGHLVITVRYVC